MVRRAITLAGGGPCAGLHIGALQEFKRQGIEFDVWSLSCIGAWVGIIYNSFDPDTAPADTENFFRENVFRNDDSYARFPMNHAFSPDILRNTQAMMRFAMDPNTYQHLIAPEAIQRTAMLWGQFLTDPARWNEGDIDNLVMESMAANPMARFMMSLSYLSPVNGMSRIYFKDSSFLKAIDFDAVRKADRPFVYHNAYNMDAEKLDHFSNRPHHDMLQLTAQSICACSALPFVEETVEIDGTTYCEGALIKTVDFDHLLDRHEDLEEVWIVRIVDPKQARAPKNIKDGIANLCMLFAGSLGKENVEEFEQVVKDRKLKIKAIPLEVSHKLSFDWNESNLDLGIKQGTKAARDAIAAYRKKHAA